MPFQNSIWSRVLVFLLIVFGLHCQAKGAAQQIHSCPSASLLAGHSEIDYRGVHFVVTGDTSTLFKGSEVLKEMSYEKSQETYYITCVYDGHSEKDMSIVGVLPGHGPYQIYTTVKGNSDFTPHPEKSVFYSNYGDEEFQRFFIMEKMS